MRKIFVCILLLFVLSGCKKDEIQEEGFFNVKEKIINWKYVVNDSYFYYSSPVLSEDENTIYIGTSRKIKEEASENNKLLAISKDGKLLWTYDTGEVRSNTSIYKDNIYFMADYDRTILLDDEPSSKSSTKLIALNKSGELLWEKKVLGETKSDDLGLSDVYVADDQVIVVTDNLYIFDYSNGDLLYEKEILSSHDWYDSKVEKHSYVRLTENNNKLYFTLLGNIYIFDIENRKLTVKTHEELNDKIEFYSGYSDFVFDKDGNIYIGDSNGKFISMDANMKLRWIYDIGNKDQDYRSTPIINGEYIYIGTKGNQDSKFFALDKNNGKLIWNYDIGYDVYSSPAIYNDLIYFGSENKKLNVLSFDGKVIEQIDLNQDITWSSPIISSDGILYIGGMGEDMSGNGMLFSINIKNRGIK